MQYEKHRLQLSLKSKEAKTLSRRMGRQAVWAAGFLASAPGYISPVLEKKLPGILKQLMADYHYLYLKYTELKSADSTAEKTSDADPKADAGTLKFSFLSYTKEGDSVGMLLVCLDQTSLMAAALARNQLLPEEKLQSIVRKSYLRMLDLMAQLLAEADKLQTHPHNAADLLTIGHAELTSRIKHKAVNKQQSEPIDTAAASIETTSEVPAVTLAGQL